MYVIKRLSVVGTGEVTCLKNKTIMGGWQVFNNCSQNISAVSGIIT